GLSWITERRENFCCFPTFTLTERCQFRFEMGTLFQKEGDILPRLEGIGLFIPTGIFVNLLRSSWVIKVKKCKDCCIRSAFVDGLLALDYVVCSTLSSPIYPFPFSVH